ncbi:MFS transporter [Shouchella lehensis]|uniref:Major facilitator superfamily protein n=1 Tax=Shouchella lehensis G1 TaxID=1246626 RepID=A0A060LSK4_9BACI|nr:MFS transporter [Shouchella lehensis]AIC93102.1 major facilitator superfamily protein [Shouchella lehensis G1]
MKLLKNRNFMVMLSGRMVTNIGEGLYAVAAMWLIFELSGSTFYTGLVGFFSIIPRLIQFVSGPIIDRLPLRQLLVSAQIIQALLLFTVPILYFFDFLNVGYLLIITPLMSLFNMIIFPAQTAALPTIVETKDLTKANSWFTLVYQGIDTLTFALGGVIVGLTGAIAVYLMDVILLLIAAFIFSFLSIRAKISPSKHKVPIKSRVKIYRKELEEGIEILKVEAFKKLLIGVLLTNAVWAGIIAISPQFAAQNGGSAFYGFLLAAVATGSLIGALIAPLIKLFEQVGLGKIYSFAFMLSGTFMLAIFFSPWNWLTILLFCLASIPGGVTNILINATIQKGIPKEMLGRVFSAAFSLSGFAAPLGSLIGGSVIGVLFGTEIMIVIGGFVTILVGSWWLVDRVTRDLPKMENITPEVFLPKRFLDKKQVDNG